MSLNQTYQIDQTQIGKIRNRVFVRSLTALFPAVGIVICMELFLFKQANLLAFGGAIFSGVIAGMSVLFIGVNRTKKWHQTLKIILNDDGVEARADTMPYKFIAWENLKVIETSNGGVYLYNKSISAFMRKSFGWGCIIIQPETLDKDLLASELYKRLSR